MDPLDRDPIIAALDDCQVHGRDVLKAAGVTAAMLAIAWLVLRSLS
jgi:hypothetical protein